MGPTGLSADGSVGMFDWAFTGRRFAHDDDDIRFSIVDIPRPEAKLRGGGLIGTDLNA